MKEGLLNDSDLFEELGINNTLKRFNKNIPSQQHTILRVPRLKDDNDTVSNEEDTS